MKILRTINELRNELAGKIEIGLVPTMGALHKGHSSLIKESKKRDKYTVVSLFVNPTQFNNENDLKTYPNTMNEDVKILKSLNVDYLFMPDSKEIYLEADYIRITDIKNSLIIEGKKRPGHFDGVLTVVLKLFNIIKPQRAYFGEKDYQQLSLIESMVKSLFLDIEIVSVKVVRDEFGLPYSSRNLKLSSKGLIAAQRAASLFKSCISKEDFIEKMNKEAEVNLDYVEEKWGRLLTVYKIEDVRILDNKEILNENSI